MTLWIRRIHRWLAPVFTLAVVANLVVMGLGWGPPAWLTYAPLPPLFVMLVTGIDLFIRPYARRRAA